LEITIPAFGNTARVYATFERTIQHLHNGMMKVKNSFACQPVGAAARVEPRAPKRFARINIPQPRDPALIEQKLL
jgi:hypothetical protein